MQPFVETPSQKASPVFEARSVLNTYTVAGAAEAVLMFATTVPVSATVAARRSFRQIRVMPSDYSPVKKLDFVA
jgi:hypothetical protein